MELFRDIAEVARLLWPVIAVILTLIGGGMLFMARKVLVFREELYDKNGKARYATVEDINAFGRRVGVVEKVASSAEQRAQGNERAIELMHQRDQHMMDRFSHEIVEPLRQMTMDMREHGKMIAEIRERISRIEGERRRNL
jgi:hypothetical protein